MQTYLLSAFTPRMLAGYNGTIRFDEVELDTAARLVELGIKTNKLTNAVLNPAIASLVSCAVDEKLPPSYKTKIALKPGDKGIVVQYNGPRLPDWTLSPEEIEKAFRSGVLTAMKFAVSSH